jgi:hypothetical protein
VLAAVVAQGNGYGVQKQKVQTVRRFVLWKRSEESTAAPMAGGRQEVSEVEGLFQQLWNIPQHPTYRKPSAATIKQVERKSRVYKLMQAAVVEETSGVECLGVESTSSWGVLVSDISMAGRGAPKGRGRGGGNQENWPQQQQQMSPQFQQQMQPPMEFAPGSFGYPPPFFMQGAMPPPWAFGGPFQQFPPNPQFGLQSNQWIVPQQSGSQSQQQQQSQGSSEQGGKGKS